jgi:error-prone DNA polymerase
VAPLGAPPLPLFSDLEERQEPPVALPEMADGEEVAHDYATLRLSLKAHPLALLRPRLAREGVIAAEKLVATDDGARVTVCGLAIVRQRPGTASGVIFVTLEDETGIANLVVWPRVFERHRAIVMGARLMRVTGKLQRQGLVTHVVTERIEDLTFLLRELAGPALPRRMAPAPELARADEPGHGRDYGPGSRFARDYPSRDFH